MGFGISFGKKKQSGSQNTTVSKTDVTDQTQTGTSSTSGSTQTSGTSTTATNQATSNTGTSATTGTTSQVANQQSTQFSEPVLGTLENSVQALFAGLPTTPSSMGGSFDHDAFVSQGVQAAQSQVQGDLEKTLNGVFDAVGGRDDQNSMATLLANRARGDAAAQIAGVRANLESTAQGIDKDRFLANLQGIGQQEGFAGQVLDALKGGRAATTGTTTGTESTTGTTTNVGTTTGTSTTAMSQTELTNQIQQILQQLQGTDTSTGTENTVSKGKNSGFGLGLSL